ncbi:penicillin-binding protein 1A [Xylophilus sp. GOD-11R]|uniref:penicillin-binding protein 1A n=1 Tax=Xylophilus sp. GOD-11R TaxID=3089814 RepID=UPI00298C7829|nr:transglycosylase domain-containing protein [Xylophilus sp. GOD-11R]WPB59294.1 transglycosylase domain-containing protein [Xylophilus sp. GOD-11R]
MATTPNFLTRAASAVRRHPWRAVACLPALLVAYVLLLIPFTPSIGDIRKARTERPAVLLSADDKVLAEFRRANREWVKLADISPHVVDALIATEDRRFYEHGGIDFRRTGAAVLNTLHGDRQGGSTITQQLARNLYPDEIGRAVSLTRKAKEAITALKIEGVYSKDEILETYLNTVSFLYNAVGIEMAARTYFDTTADKLDPLQSATLVGMLKGTSYYNPVNNPDRARDRRNIVLAQMVRSGALPETRLAELQKTPLKVDFERQTDATGPAPHLARQLRNWLFDWSERNGYDIYADGLRVRTTIDSRLQDFANRAVQKQADQLQRSADAMYAPRAWNPKRPEIQAMVRETAAYKSARDGGADDADALRQAFADADAMKVLRVQKSRLQAGFMALDPRDGQVRAWVGSRGYAEDQFDHVSQARRQPGSTFKPFVYGTAFAQGISPDESFMDEPIQLALGNGQVWSPTDEGEPSYAPMTLRDGLAFSKNIITAQLMQQVGPKNVADLARAMGVRQSKLDEVPSLALGTSPVTLKEMVTAYGSIANGGNFIEPILVLRIEDRDGKVLEEFHPGTPETALAQAPAQTLLDAMRGVIDRGTGAAIRSRYGIRGDLAGKTGTTQDNTDGWFILMHPQLVAGAWVGFNDSRMTMGGSWGQGARSALPMVGDFMAASLRAKVVDAAAEFDAPRQPIAPAQPDPSTSPPVERPENLFRPGGEGEGNGPISLLPPTQAQPVAMPQDMQVPTAPSSGPPLSQAAGDAGLTTAEKPASSGSLTRLSPSEADVRIGPRP